MSKGTFKGMRYAINSSFFRTATEALAAYTKGDDIWFCGVALAYADLCKRVDDENRPEYDKGPEKWGMSPLQVLCRAWERVRLTRAGPRRTPSAASRLATPSTGAHHEGVGLASRGVRGNESIAGRAREGVPHVPGDQRFRAEAEQGRRARSPQEGHRDREDRRDDGGRARRVRAQGARQELLEDTMKRGPRPRPPLPPGTRMFVIGWKFGDGTCVLFDDPVEIGGGGESVGLVRGGKTVKNQALLYNSTTDTQVGDTYDIDGHVFEVVEDFGDGQYRLNDGRHDMPFTRDQLAKCDRVAAL